MADTKRILRHIAELYAKPRANQDIDDAINEMEEKLSARYNEYDKAFEEKLTVNLIKAIDDYWRFKNDKTRPTLAQILSMENADITKKDRIDDLSSDDDRRKIIALMKKLYYSVGLDGAQVFYDGLLNKHGAKYPETEEELLRMN